LKWIFSPFGECLNFNSCKKKNESFILFLHEAGYYPVFFNVLLFLFFFSKKKETSTELASSGTCHFTSKPLFKGMSNSEMQFNTLNLNR